MGLPTIPRFVRVGISLFFLLVLVWWINPQRILQDIFRVSLSVILVILAGLAAALMLNALAVFTLLRLSGHSHLPFTRLFPRYIMSWSTELFFPGKLGVFALAYFLRALGIETGEGLAIVFLQKVASLSVLAVVSALGLISVIWYPEMAEVIGFLLMGAIVLLLLLRGKKTLRQWIFTRLRLERIPLLPESWNAARRLFQNPVLPACAVVFAFLGLGVSTLVMTTVFSLLGHPVPFFQMLVVMSAAQLTGIIPFTLNGYGAREGIGVLLLTRLGVPSSIALLGIALNSGVAILISLGIALFVANDVLRGIQKNDK